MSAETRSTTLQAQKVYEKVSGSISRRSKQRRRYRKDKTPSSSSVISGISSCCSESLDILSNDLGESSISESSNTPLACEPIEEDIIKLTIDVPVNYYGDYRTINQKEFFVECMINSEGSSVVHFFDENDPASIELDRMMGQMARKYTACKFLRINSTGLEFLCSKLMIDTFPTVLAIRNKVILDRVVNFECTDDKFEDWILRSIPLIKGPQASFGAKKASR